MFGLSFLQPLLLWASLAAGLPIVLHLLRRQRFRELPFSGLIFVSADLRRQLRASRLTHLLLLALRVLLILAVVLAVSGPRFGQMEVTGKATSLAIVIDVSASMGARSGGTTALDAARRIAIQQIKALRASDRVSLIAASRQIQTLSVERADGPDIADELIRKLEPTYLAGDLSAALQEAGSILQNSALPRRRLLVLTDGQEVLGPQAELAKRGIELEIQNVGSTSSSNFSVVDLALPRAIEGQASLRIAARITNGGNARAVGTVRLNLDGAFLADRSLSLRPGAADQVYFDVPSAMGPRFGFIELAGDDLEADNRRFFVLGLESHVPVALVGTPENRKYVQLALDLEGVGDSIFEVTAFSSIAEVLASPLAKPRVVILCDLAALEPMELEGLDRLRQLGAGVLVFLGEQTIPSLFNERGAGNRILPFRLTGKESGDWSARVVQPRHRLLPGGAALDGVLGNLSFRQRHRIVPLDRGGLNLLEYEDGEPLLTELLGQSPPILVATTSPKRDFGDFSLSPYFVLLVRRAADHLSGTREQGWLPVGAPVPEIQGGQGRWEWLGDPANLVPAPLPQGLSMPGALIQIDADGKASQWKEVSVDPAESRLAGAGGPESGSTLPSVPSTTGEPESWAFPFAILALLLFLAEAGLTIRLTGQEAIG